AQRLGNHTLMFFSYFGKDKEVDTYRYTLLNDVEPKTISWKVVKTFPHGVKSYTQGLFFKDGFLFEGTGQWGQSSLRKIDLAKNEVIKTYSLPHDIFGEGIVAYKNKIIELTWQSREAFEYDAESFKLINRFTYDTEGWGITNYGDSLLMSDGTNLLYILDPASFTVIDKIQVFDDKGPVKNLNELENINGQIFANVYQTDDIVVINPKTGVVTHKINLKGLLSDDERTPQTDVLNGIAWDNDRKIFLVTGKNWPHMYQLALTEIDL
ncbi:MAG: glutaminyl-peptide cyclotransferase, partial [Bacteroidales bacterium]|nr:glutaminyl-peptide cyclotransferase [Bacteroidales bacterium]